jgi:hypothetical protein
LNAGDLIASAMRLIGATASGEIISAAEATDGLMVLQQMLDSWAADRLLVYTISIGTFTLTPGTQTYTLGPGGAFNAARPAKIDSASIVSLNNPAQPLELQIDLYTDEDWQAIPVKNISSPRPQGVYDDGSFPLRNLSFWPVPSAVVKAILYSWTALTQFTDLVSDVTFPPGYPEAIRYNLAMRLIAEMPGNFNPLMAQVTGELAVSSLARIRSINIPLIEKNYGDVPSGHGARYNYYSDMPVGGKN